MFHKLRKNLIYYFIILAVLILSVPQTASAAGLTVLSDTLTRLATTTLSNHDLKFKTANGMSSSTFTIDFNTAGFSSGSVNYTDIDLRYGSSQAQVNGTCSSSCTKATLAGTADADTWGAAFDTNTLTFTYPTSGGTAIAGNDYVRIPIGTNAADGTTGDQQMTNPGSTGNKVITITLPTDSGKLAVVIATDQVTVSTTIDPYLTFAVTQTTVSLTRSGGVLNPDYQNTGYNNGTANTLAANTNANTGYTISYNGATLTGPGGTINAIGATPAANNEGTEQFGINLMDNTDPNTGLDPDGIGAPETNYGSADYFAYEAGATTPLASAGASATTTYTVTYIVNVGQTTEAGAYSTVITYIATGNF